MSEYQAMIYKNNRNRTFIANCLMKNLMGYGKTEKDAVENLRKSLQASTGEEDVNIKALYKLQLANNM